MVVDLRKIDEILDKAKVYESDGVDLKRKIIDASFEFRKESTNFSNCCYLGHEGLSKIYDGEQDDLEDNEIEAIGTLAGITVYLLPCLHEKVLVSLNNIMNIENEWILIKE